MDEKIINRVFKYLEHTDVPHTRFEKEIGLSNGYLKKMLTSNADVGEGVLLKIIENILHVNVRWLVTGKGNMFPYENSAPNVVSEPTPQYGNNDKEGEITALKKVIDAQDKTIKALEMVIATKSSEKGNPDVVAGRS